MVDDNVEGKKPENNNDPSENENDTGKINIEEIKRQLQQELSEIDRNDREALKALAEKYRLKLEEVIREIDQLREGYEKASSDQERKKKKKEIKDKLTQVVKAGEFLKEVSELTRQEQVVVNKKADRILIGLADGLASGEITEVEAAKAFDLLGEYLTGKKEIIITEDSSFSQRLLLLQYTSKKTLEKIVEQVGKNPQLFGIDQEKARELQRQFGGRNGERTNIEEYVRRMDEYVALRSTVEKAINDYLRKNADVDGGISLLRRYLALDRSVSFDSVKDILDKLGLRSADVQKLNNLRTETLNRPIDIHRLAPFLGDPTLIDLLTRSVVDFKPERLIQKYVTYSADGRPQITRENRIKLSKEIVKFYYLALQKVHANTSNYFEQAKGQGNNIDYYLGGLRGVIDNSLTSLGEAIFFNDPETLNWLTDRATRFQSSIVTYAAIFHDLPLYARDVGSFEKWPEFLGRLFPSELAEAFYGDPVMEVARSVITNYLKRRIYLNKGGKIPPDLFSREFNENEVRYSYKDAEEIKRLIIQQLEFLKERKLISDFEGWEIDRAINYSLGIGLASLIDPELIATANPNIGDEFRGIYPLASHMSAKHNWGLGRGYPGANLTPELMVFDVTMFPEERGALRFFKKKKWVPEFIRKLVGKNVQYYGEKVWDELIDRDGNYQELLSLINIYPGLTSRAGWRFKHLFEDIKKEGGFDFDNKTSWSNEEWDRFYDLAAKKYGATSLWWWAGEKVGARLENFLHHYFGKDHHNLHLFKEGKALIEIEVEGKRHRIRMATLKQIIDNQVRGELFFKFLKRNPGDFFLILTHMIPELKDLDSFKDNTGFFVDRKTFEEKVKALKLDKDKEQAYFQKYEMLLRRWGGEKFLVELGKVRSWMFDNLDKVVGYMKDKGIVAKDADLKLDKKIELFYQFLTEESLAAYNTLRLSDKTYLDKEIVQNPLLNQLLFDESNGLFNILKSAGSDDPTKRDLFYFMAQTWWYKEGLVNPFNSDINHFAVFQKLGRAGEDVLKRALGDANAVSKMIQEVGKLDKLLRHIAVHPGEFKLDEIYKIHETVFDTLKGIIGPEYAYRANYILAQIVTKFFWEHDITRNTFLNYLPFGRHIAKLFLGNKVSLSKLVTGYWRAHTMDSNTARNYFRKLAYELEVLPHEGDFSYEHLEREFDASSDVYIATEFAPNAFYFIIAFLIFTYIKRALEEDKKK